MTQTWPQEATVTDVLALAIFAIVVGVWFAVAAGVERP